MALDVDADTAAAEEGADAGEALEGGACEGWGVGRGAAEVDLVAAEAAGPLPAVVFWALLLDAVVFVGAALRFF